MSGNKRSEFKTWKSIWIGTRKKPGTLLNEIGNHPLRNLGRFELVGNETYHIANEMTLVKKREEIDLVKADLGELGFRQGAKMIDVFERAFSLGLALCPPEVGLQLLLQYTEQNRWDSGLEIAMEPLKDPYTNELHAFVIYGNGRSLLTTVREGIANELCHAGQTWIFMRSKSRKSTKRRVASPSKQ